MEEITLEQLLASREERWHRQMMFIRDFPSLTLVCLTVIMPGAVKRSDRSLVVAKAAVKAMREAFGDTIRRMDEHDLVTGYEVYLLTTLPVEEAKLTACRIEDTHPLGRLFDIDVIDQSATPVSRSIVGMASRRCLLCDNEARYCMRNRTHTPEELHDRIRQMIDDYVQRL
ncbi:MAG: citrate lyase holo-[acyl-carrier protein] synthase [Bacteroidales bacterium]|nr:citrate lyase holo-[acyl-carrier protein] synthase [Bacteroidales bacterium]